MHCLPLSFAREVRCLLDEEPNRKVDIAVYCYITKGFGDLSGCASIFLHLSSAFPNHPVKLMVQKKFTELVKRYNPHLPVSYFTHFEDRHSLTLHYPFQALSEDIQRFADEFQTPILQSPRTHFLIFEYGNVPPAILAQAIKELGNGISRICSTGFHEDALGIIWNARLRQSRSGNLSKLMELPSYLSDAILRGESLEEFAEHTKLYAPLYSHQPASKNSFIQIVSDKRLEDRDLAMVLVGNTKNAGGWLSRDYWQEGSNSLLEQIVEQQGFKEMRIWRQRGDQKIRLAKKRIFDGEGKRKLRLLVLESLPNPQMMTLKEASEPLGLGTGDQSLGDLLSAYDVAAYENFIHKWNLISPLVDLVRKHDPVMGGHFKVLATLIRREVEEEYGEPWSLDDDQLERAVEAVKYFRTNKTGWDQFIDGLYRRFNLLAHLEAIVREEVARQEMPPQTSGAAPARVPFLVSWKRSLYSSIESGLQGLANRLFDPLAKSIGSCLKGVLADTPAYFPHLDDTTTYDHSPPACEIARQVGVLASTQLQVAANSTALLGYGH